MGRYSGRNDDGIWVILTVVFFAGLILFWLTIGPTACQADSVKVRKMLEREGYTHINTTGYNYFACSDDDYYNQGFTARKNNESVKGTVCCGMSALKNCTIRFEE